MYYLDYKIPKYLDRCCDELLPSFLSYLHNDLGINITPNRGLLARRSYQCFLFNSARSVKLESNSVGVILKESFFSKPLHYNGVKVNRSVSYTYTKHLFAYLQKHMGCELQVGGVTKWEFDKISLYTDGLFRVIPSDYKPSKIILSDELYSIIQKCIDGKHLPMNHSVVEVRDEHGNTISKRMTIKQRESIDTLNQYNKKVMENKFTLEGKVMDFYVKKVYNHSSLEKGGRNYIMGLNARDILDKENRRYIRINGEQCMELDYSALFPRIIADFLGVKLEKDYDPYTIELDGYDKEALRTACKVGMMCILNTKDTRAASLALAGELSKGDWKELISKYTKQGLWKDGRYAFEIIDKLLEKNKFIADNKESIDTMRVMNAESHINDIIMQKILMDDQILLPVHDSFVVPISYEERCEEIMYLAYELVVGGNNCVVRKIIAHY